MKKSLKKTLLCTALSVIPAVYSYHMYNDLNEQLKQLERQNKQQQKLIKQLQQDVKNTKESEDRLRQRYDEEIKGIEERIKQMKEKYKNNYMYSFESVVTAYTAGYESTQKHKSHPLYGVTASGTKAKQGTTIAMDKSIPFGTLVKIEGFDNIFVVQDRGEKIKGNRVDVYFDSVEDAIKFGNHKRKIYIIKLVKGIDKHN